ncbi:hypothetical protein J1614_002529 [Plenodomus biglobosus]|nr:hypothetical protein J1614_002529 [Plenodomus biglobosus]
MARNIDECTSVNETWNRDIARQATHGQDPVAMSPTTSKLHDPQQEIITTTLFISNLHCPSCVEAIKVSLTALAPAPQNIVVSIVSHSVVVRHSAFLTVNAIAESLEISGFEVHSIFQNNKSIYHPVEVKNQEAQGKEWHSSLEHAVSSWLHPQGLDGASDAMRKQEIHEEQCVQCKREGGGVSLEINSGGVSLQINSEEDLSFKPAPIVTASPKASFDGSVPYEPKSPVHGSFVTIDRTSPTTLYKATLALSGMTCSACVGAITHALEQHTWVQTVNINLLTSSGVVIFHGKNKCHEIVETIEDCGFDVTVEKLEEISAPGSRPILKSNADRWRATYAFGGLTCAACVGNVTRALKPLEWIEQVDINLVSNSATIVFKGKEHLPEIQETIEDIGYEASLDKIVPAESKTTDATTRTVVVRVDGMFCHHCPQNIMQTLNETYAARDTFAIEEPLLSLSRPLLQVLYTPDPAKLTIRHILETIKSLNPLFDPSIYHPPTLEERAREMHASERKRILFRLVLCVIVALPTFVLGIVFMSLISDKDPIRTYLMESMWVGNVNRLSWALFILATPIYFFAADTFHRRALKELRAMWRPGSRTPLSHRFLRFGSMNLLISLGTSIAYLASIVELALAATKKSSGSMTDSYFDAVVFLTMFLLIGRFLEAYSKAKTGDAVTSLGKLRPTEATLVDAANGDCKIATDLLEFGDVVRVHHGTSPPFDGTVLDSNATFDESSLTGESRPVKKERGDIVYSGTVNKGPPIKISITSVSGTSMLDQIINAVREGQTRRAPVERVADTITAHFVPFVIAVAILTWLIWLLLGTTGGIPKDWKSEGAGGWALWSLRFAIAVFVIACPCGIGLAAPTALFVGGGLAAKYGILVRGGGEAFQEASSLDCIVFDKTGTLTQGGDPKVANHALPGPQNSSLVFGIVKALEENSNHPISRALLSFCDKQSHNAILPINVDEVPGKGLKGTFRVDSHEITAIIGNESYMSDHHVDISPEHAATLQNWKALGHSVALLSLINPPNAAWTLACMFSIADPLRPEAVGVIDALKKRNIDVWMLSGDNATTAHAVGAQVGIPASNIIAGVLPDQKAEKIKYLQQTLTKPHKTVRATIAMVGDGINDAPALSAADLSIAVGSGSDIALSSSSFILINSRLTTILTLLDLSRVVFRRVYFNFGWALVYNLIAMPVAAGVLFPITTGAKTMDMHNNGVGMEAGMAMESGGAKHIRLDPVWASLAMALSSVSVVCSSLALRSRIPGIGFRARTDVGVRAERRKVEIV